MLIAKCLKHYLTYGQHSQQTEYHVYQVKVMEKNLGHLYLKLLDLTYTLTERWKLVQIMSMNSMSKPANEFILEIIIVDSA